MEKITFNGLGLNFYINQIAIKFHNISIYWYAIFIVLAFIVGIALCRKDNGKYNIKFENILELAIIMIPVAIISARIYFILFKLEYYIQNPSKILDIRNGGLAIYGGIIGAIITIIIYCKKKDINILDMLDYIVPYLALGQAIGRWGNFFNMEAYGTETNSIFRMGIVKNFKFIEVHPTFLYESVGCLLIFILLYNIRNKRKYKGQLTYIYLSLYGFIRAIIEGLRTDSLMLGNFRVSQVLSIILCITFSAMLIYKNNKNKGKNNNITTEAV